MDERNLQVALETFLQLVVGFTGYCKFLIVFLFTCIVCIGFEGIGFDDDFSSRCSFDFSVRHFCTVLCFDSSGD